MISRIAAQRLQNQHIAKPGPRDPASVVAWFGAVQAQDYAAAKWGLALRLPPGASDMEIDRAFDEGRILRTHVMRPTWHFVTAADIYWLLELTAPRVHRALGYGNRQFELDRTICVRAANIFQKALSGGRFLTRAELAQHLARAGIAARGVRLALLTIYAEVEGILCSGPRRGRQMTYALLAERAPRARRLSRDEAIAELTTRYLRSHGPATIRDFTWWSGLTTADAKRGLDIKGAHSTPKDGLTYWTLGGLPGPPIRRPTVHLLPIYDEYLVAYRDLEAVPRKSGAFGILQQAVIANGQVAGTWKAVRQNTKKAHPCVVAVTLHRKLAPAERRALTLAVERFGAFTEERVSLAIA